MLVAGNVRFKNIDIDSSGDLTLSELVLGGHLTKAQADELFEKCHRQNDTAISDKDEQQHNRAQCQCFHYHY